MRLIRVRSLLLAVVVGLGALFISLGLLGMTPSVMAQGPQAEVIVPVSQAPPEDDFGFFVVFTDPLNVEITDLSRNILDEGVHLGKVKCKRDNCSQKTQLQLTIPLTDPWSVEYKFTGRQSIDPVAERVVVAGTGKISSRTLKERFSFTATFQNNRDGTVWVKYEASRPDASFIVPNSAGTFRISSRR